MVFYKSCEIYKSLWCQFDCGGVQHQYAVLKDPYMEYKLNIYVKIIIINLNVIFVEKK